MHRTATVLGATALAASLAVVAVQPASAARRSPQAAHCKALADKGHLQGGKRGESVSACMKGPMAATAPTAPTAGNKESQAVTKPSGVDRATRTKQCNAEADKKGLAAKERSAFQLSCLATAGPVTEGETGTISPHPANRINGIGVNNYKPSATTAKSKPKP